MDNSMIQLIGQYGIVGLLFYFFIKEFFAWLNRGNKDIDVKNVAKELKLQNENHLEHIQAGITDGFKCITDCQNSGTKEIVRAINEMHIDIIKELSKKS